MLSTVMFSKNESKLMLLYSNVNCLTRFEKNVVLYHVITDLLLILWFIPFSVFQSRLLPCAADLGPPILYAKEWPEFLHFRSALPSIDLARATRSNGIF